EDRRQILRRSAQIPDDHGTRGSRVDLADLQTIRAPVEPRSLGIDGATPRLQDAQSELSSEILQDVYRHAARVEVFPAQLGDDVDNAPSGGSQDTTRAERHLRLEAMSRRARISYSG